MTRQEFADKWGYQTGEGYGCALFDCRKTLLKDLDVLITDEVKNLALPHVSKREDVEREPPCKHSDWVDLYGSCHDYYGRLCTDCNEWIK